jgi:hypothetical protein
VEVINFFVFIKKGRVRETVGFLRGRGSGNRRFPEREGYSEAAGNLSEAKGSLR